MGGAMQDGSCRYPLAGHWRA